MRTSMSFPETEGDTAVAHASVAGPCVSHARGIPLVDLERNGSGAHQAAALCVDEIELEGAALALEALIEEDNPLDLVARPQLLLVGLGYLGYTSGARIHGRQEPMTTRAVG